MQYFEKNQERIIRSLSPKHINPSIYSARIINFKDM